GTVSDTRAADGTVSRTVADLVANTTHTGTLAADADADAQEGSGLEGARAVAGQRADDAGRITEAHTVFADAALPAPPKASTAYDGLGRVRTATAGDLVTTPAYGTGGAQTGTSMQPAQDSPYQGRKFTAEQSLDLSGGSVHKVLTQGEGEQAESRGGTRNVLDLAGRVRVQVDQLGNTTTLVHTRDGQIASSTTRTPGKDGQDGTLVSKTANTYDQATGRLVSTTVTSADGTALTRSMHYDTLGRITHVWEGTPKDGQDKTDAYTKSVIGYGYDADGNTTTVTYPDGTTLTQAFDEAGRLTTSTDAAGAVTEYSYHPETGRLERAVQKAEDGTELASAAYTYDTLGRLESVKHGNKTTTRYEYFDNDQPRTQTLTRDDGGEVLARTAYTYNSHGNLETRTDTRPAVKNDGTTDTDSGNVTTHTVHTYDAYDRLTRTVLHEGDNNTEGKIVKQTDYQINASGDVTKMKVTGGDGAVSETVNEIDAAGRRTSVTTDEVKAEQAWDAAGNLTTDRHGNQTAYNPDNKPTTIIPTQPGQAKLAIAYWADGSRRSATTTDSEGAEQITTYHYTPTGTFANDTTQGLTASYLTTPQGHEHRTLIQDGKPTGDTAGTGYLMTDRRGNTLALTGSHDATITTAYYYEDYGRPTTHHTTPLTPNPDTDRAHTNPIQYGGEYTNTWDHTQYTPARTYTTDGYFTTRDTFQLHNRYQAFGTDPTNHTDPTGNVQIKGKRSRSDFEDDIEKWVPEHIPGTAVHPPVQEISSTKFRPQDNAGEMHITHRRKKLMVSHNNVECPVHVCWRPGVSAKPFMAITHGATSYWVKHNNAPINPYDPNVAVPVEDRGNQGLYIVSPDGGPPTLVQNAAGFPYGGNVDQAYTALTRALHTLTFTNPYPHELSVMVDELRGYVEQATDLMHNISSDTHTLLAPLAKFDAARNHIETRGLARRIPNFTPLYLNTRATMTNFQAAFDQFLQSVRTAFM
ncbi:hypothetical protein ABT187_47500, partial [Streptomyces sp. NPDC001817]